MSKQTINIGASPNDGTGTPLRTSFDFTNQNFTELYTALGGGVGLPGATTQVIFNDGGTNLAGDAGLVYNKTTDALTVGGLVTAGSATITGDLTVAADRFKIVTASTAIQIGSTTQTQIGTTAWPSTTIGKSGSRFLFGNSGEAIVWNEAAPAINNYSILIIGSKTGAGATTLSGLQIRGGIENATDQAGFCSFWTSPSTGGFLERYKIDSNGISTWSVAGTTAMTLNSTGLGIANGNVILSTSGKGIDFSATANGSGTMTSELLNDYEEGTWTPVLRGVTTAGSYTFSFGVGKYTKIGRLVMVSVSFVDVTQVTAGSGAIQITGLPFSIANDDPGTRGVVGELLIRQCNALSTAKNMYVQGSGGSTSVFFNFFNGTDDIGVDVSTIISGSTDFGFTLQYTV